MLPSKLPTTQPLRGQIVSYTQTDRDPRPWFRSLHLHQTNPIDLCRLRRSVRIAFTDFEDTNTDYVPRLYQKNLSWDPNPAPPSVEKALDNFETQSTTLFREHSRRPPSFNLSPKKVQLLRRLKNDRKLIVTETDKNLGPAIMELDTYISQANQHHLNNTNNYEELTETDAKSISESNYRWICK